MAKTKPALRISITAVGKTFTSESVFFWSDRRAQTQNQAHGVPTGFPIGSACEGGLMDDDHYF